MKKNINNIFITGDMLRLNALGQPAQDANIRWLYYLLKPSLEYIVDIPIRDFLFGNHQYGFAASIYRHHGLPQTQDSWAKLYSIIPDTRILALIWTTFSESLIISFELPEIIRKGLVLLDIPFVDFTIHPVRFLDDLILGIRSNILGIKSIFQDLVISEAEMRIGAGAALATLSRIPRLQECQGENLALFAGQQNGDKVLIKGKRFINIDDVFEQLSEMTQRHELILVKSHPYEKNNAIIAALIGLFPNTKMVDYNFYHIISHKSISHVYSISSSTSIEAAWLGKYGVHLWKYPFIFSDRNISMDSLYLSIKPYILKTSIWSSLFSILNIQTHNVKPIFIEHGRSWARKSLRNFWGAEIFE